MNQLNFIFFISIFFVSMQVGAQEKLASIQTEKGLFAVGFSGGMTKSGLMNATGDSAGYQTTNFGADFDMQLWGYPSTGQVRLFLSYLVGDGQSTSNSQNTVRTEETILGLKISANPYFYIGAGAGPGRVDLKSIETNSNINFTNTLTKLSTGVEFAVTDSWFLGIEAAYRSGGVSRSGNTTLSANSFYEGSSAVLRIIWSPPTVINNFISK